VRVKTSYSRYCRAPAIGTERVSFHFPTAMVVSVSVAAVVLGVLAAILPARRAAQLKVIEALTYE
jgi:ABC-type lipoprotein release transport system permease subunit